MLIQEKKTRYNPDLPDGILNTQFVNDIVDSTNLGERVSLVSHYFDSGKFYAKLGMGEIIEIYGKGKRYSAKWLKIQGECNCAGFEEIKDKTPILHFDGLEVVDYFGSSLDDAKNTYEKIVKDNHNKINFAKKKKLPVIVSGSK